jgi:tRNA-dihydrouridine synthase A
MGAGLPALIRPMLGLFHGRPGARSWRRILTVESIRSGAGLEVIDRALAAVSETKARLERDGLKWELVEAPATL